ncbi:hypothetical protein B0I37DRAFT_436830 [Chaetomium sp. MPI-CAGE-AT-0009]|nr:hypothetical protein B0I37DRAFT_436830 [Chaetomium sp. MPI-CAGE-AT-0009]
MSMSAVFRAPTANRLQRLLPTRPLPSQSPPTPFRRRFALPRQTHPSFSTSRAVRNTRNNTNTTNGGSGSSSGNNNGTVNANATGNPSYPRFDLRAIVPNPRARRALVAAFCVMVVAETYMWVTYWPRIMGWWGEGGRRRGRGRGRSEEGVRRE